MKDITLPLRTGYVALLNNITVAGKIIKTYDLMAPKEADSPYVVISEMLSISQNTKDSFMSEVTVDLLIYARSDGDFGGRKTTDLIADALLQLIIPIPGRSGVSASGFNVYMAKQIGSQDEMDYTSTGRKYRKRLTIEHLVQEL